MGTAGHPADRPGPGVNESGRTRPGNDSSPPDYRQELRPGGSTVDPESWAGSIPQEYGISPRIRVGRSRWFNLLWLLPIGWFLLLVAVAVARELRTLQPVQDFIARYPGTHLTPTLEQDAGFPRWVAAQHFLNIFLFIFMAPIIGMVISIMPNSKGSKEFAQMGMISMWQIAVLTV